MNLPDKRSKAWGLLMALFLFVSCEESGDFGLNDNIGDAIEFGSNEIDVQSSVVILDSITTSDLPRYLLGSVEDSRFGKITSTVYSQLDINVFGIPIFNEEANFDSVTMELNFEYLLKEVATNIEFSIFPLAEELVRDTRYSFETLALEGTDIGSGTLTVTPETLDSTYSFRMSDTWGAEIFQLLKDDAPEVETLAAWQEFFQGFAIVPSASNSNILALTNSEAWEILIHFSQPSANNENEIVNASHRLRMNTVWNYQAINAERAGSEIVDVDQVSTEILPASGLRYVQEATGILTKLDISDFDRFVSENPEVLINQATITIGPVEELPDGTLPPSSILFYLTDDRNTLIPDRSFFRPVQEDGTSVLSSSNPLILTYNAEDKQYTGSMTSFIQAKYSGQVFLSDQFFIYPTSLRLATGGFAISPENVKLEIFFSQLRQ